MAEDIIRREGGLNDIKEDKGGITNCGVSLRYAKGIGLDLDGDGDTDADDIRLVTAEVAVDLFLDDFFHSPRIDRLITQVHPFMFDTAVNCGAGRAVILLQKVVNHISIIVPESVPSGPLKPDGGIGPKTRRALTEAYEAAGDYVINALVEERIKYYQKIIAADPSQEIFRKGWIRRANEFLMEV
jgi:lysozyme family protein